MPPTRPLSVKFELLVGPFPLPVLLLSERRHAKVTQGPGAGMGPDVGPTAWPACLCADVVQSMRATASQLMLSRALQMQYVLACMREQWGGRDKADCVRKMSKTAQIVSGGIDLG